jgi:hypothetical protein
VIDEPNRATSPWQLQAVLAEHTPSLPGLPL